MGAAGKVRVEDLEDLKAYVSFPVAARECPLPRAFWSWAACAVDPAEQVECCDVGRPAAGIEGERHVLCGVCVVTADVATLRPREELRSGQPSARRQTLESVSTELTLILRALRRPSARRLV